MPYLIEDIHSSAKRSVIYGKAGDKVEIVSDEHESVLIVRSTEKDAFPILKHQISNSIPSTILNAAKAAKKRR